MTVLDRPFAACGNDIQIAYRYGLIEVGGTVEARRYVVHSMLHQFVPARASTEQWNQITERLFAYWESREIDRVDSADFLQSCRFAQGAIMARSRAMLYLLSLFKRRGWESGWIEPLKQIVQHKTPLQGELLDQLGLFQRINEEIAGRNRHLSSQSAYRSPNTLHTNGARVRFLSRMKLAF